MRTDSLVLCRGYAVVMQWLCRGYTSLVRYSYSAYVIKGEEIRAIKNSVVYTSGMAIPFILSDRN
jgi:uncharacterized membrane protein (UPF0182 family)